MITFLKTMFNTAPTEVDPLIEGLYADQYAECDTGGARAQIRREYRRRWPEPSQNPTPLSHPWLFDPCEPPQGWRYDPYYECWINIED